LKMSLYCHIFSTFRQQYLYYLKMIGCLRKHVNKRSGDQYPNYEDRLIWL